MIIKRNLFNRIKPFIKKDLLKVITDVRGSVHFIIGISSKSVYF